MRKGELDIFTEADSDHAENMLKAIVIRLFIEHKISFKVFSDKHREFMLDSGFPPDKIASSRNNLLKALLNKQELTYNMFEFILKNILKLNLTNVSMTLRDSKNKSYMISMDRITF